MRKIVRLRKVLKALGACGDENVEWERAGQPETLDEWFEKVASNPVAYSPEENARWRFVNFTANHGLRLPYGEFGFTPTWTVKHLEAIKDWLERTSDRLGLTEWG